MKTTKTANEYIKVVMAVLLLLTLNDSFAQNSLPAFTFPSIISAGPITVKSDTRNADGTTGTIVGTVSLDFSQPKFSASLKVSMTATWQAATKKWSFTENTSVSSDLGIKGVSFSKPKLVESNGNWVLSGNVSLAALQQLSNYQLPISTNGTLTIQEGITTITSTKSNPSATESGVALNIDNAIALNRINNEWVPVLSGQLTVMGVAIQGSISYSGNQLVFTGKPTNSTRLGGDASITYQSITYTLGSHPSIDATATFVSTSALINQILPPSGFEVTVSGSPGHFTYSASKKSAIPQLTIGSTGKVSFWPVEIIQSSTTTSSSSYDWNVGVLMTLAGKSISGKVDFTSTEIKLKELQLPGGLPSMDFDLKKVNNAWTVGNDVTVSAAQLSPLMNNVNLGALSGSIPLNTSITDKAYQVTITSLPSLPSGLPAWLKPGSGSDQSITITHDFNSVKTVASFVLNLDLSAVPGFENIGTMPFAFVAGDEVVPVDASSTSFNTSWFLEDWKELGDPNISKYGWYKPENTSSSKGIAFGPASSLNIALNGISNTSIKSILGGYTKGSWNLGGIIEYTPAFESPILQEFLSDPQELDFTYDGKKFSATKALNHQYNLVPSASLMLSFSSLNLVHENSWELSIGSIAQWFGTHMPGKVTVPSSGPPNFSPTINANGVKIDFPGSVDPTFKTLSITLGSEYSCTGTAIIANSSDPIASTIPSTTIIDFSASKSDGWSLSSKAKPGSNISGFSIGADHFYLNDFNITRSQPQAPLSISGGGNVTFSSGSNLNYTFSTGDNQSIITINDFEPIAGMSVAASLVVTGSGSSKTYAGKVSGSLDIEDVKALYGAFNLSTAATSVTNTSISGSFSSTSQNLTIRNLPAMTMGALENSPGLHLGNIDIIELNHQANTTQLAITAQLGMDQLAPLNANGSGGITTTITIQKPASANDPLELDILLKGHTTSNVGIGNLTFTSLDIGYHNSNWAVDGKMVLNNLSPFIVQGMQKLKLGSSFNLDMSYEANTSQYSLTNSFKPVSNIVIIPNQIAIDLSAIQLISNASGIDLSLVSALNINQQPYPGIIGFNPTNASIDFKPQGSVNIGFSESIKNAGSLTVSNMMIAIGEKLTVSGDAKVSIAKPDDLVWKAMGLTELTGDFSASNQETIITVDIPNAGLGGSFSLGHLGNAALSLRELTVSTEGEVLASGTAAINSFSADITIGTTDVGPQFTFKPHGASKLRSSIENTTKSWEFAFSASDQFTLATNIAGIPTLSFPSVNLKIDDPSTNTSYINVDATNLVYYLPPEAGPGFIFFDKFEGYVNIAGLDGNVELQFPDPLPPTASDQVKQEILTLLHGGTFAQILSEMKTPMFSIKNSYVELPSNLFPGAPHLSIPDKTSEVSALGNMIQIPDLKDIAKTLLLEALNDIKGTHTASVLGVSATSYIGFHSDGTFSCSMDFDSNIGSHAGLDATLSGAFDKSSFRLESKGDVRIKGGSMWQTAAGADITLTEEGLTFDGEILKSNGSGTITASSFSFSGDLNTSVLVGSISGSPSHFHISASGYVDDTHVATISANIEHGYVDVGLSGDPSGKGYDLHYSGHLSFILQTPV